MYQNLLRPPLIQHYRKNLNKKAIKTMMPMQLGDVKKTYADINESKKRLGYSPNTEIKDGLLNFVKNTVLTSQFS